MATWTYGMFVWRELMTSDVKGALRFYGELAGWKERPVDRVEGTYHLLLAGERPVAGLMALPPAAPPKPLWQSFLSVPDVDEALRVAKAKGGHVAWGPMALEGVGRAATVVDPLGAAFSVLHADGGDAPGEAGLPGPGTFCWEQLHTSDFALSRDFYGALTGWKGTVMPGAPFEVLGFGARPGEQAASLAPVPPGADPGWLTFLVVDALAGARARATRLGATVLAEEVPVPGVGRYAVIRDPQGAVLALFTP